jgi:uncharacterized protein
LYNSPDTGYWLLQALILCTIALFIALIDTRRQVSSQRVMQRLGVQRLSYQDVWRGILVGSGLVLLYAVWIVVWQVLAPSAITRLADSILVINRAYQSDLLTALLLASIAGISEELFFRGAVQPRLGIILTTLFFVAFHPHLWLTIGMVWVGVLSVVWGLVRQHQNTNTAIVAHICYNFLPVVLIFALGTV